MKTYGRYLVCCECDKPITDEKNAWTVENDQSVKVYCDPCGEKLGFEYEWVGKFDLSEV